MTKEQEAEIKAHIYNRIQEKRRQCEQNNAFNCKPIKDDARKDISDKKRNNSESIMKYIIKIDNKVIEFQKEHPNICNVLEAATDAVSTAGECLNLIKFHSKSFS